MDRSEKAIQALHPTACHGKKFIFMNNMVTIIGAATRRTPENKDSSPKLWAHASSDAKKGPFFIPNPQKELVDIWEILREATEGSKKVTLVLNSLSELHVLNQIKECAGIEIPQTDGFIKSNATTGIRTFSKKIILGDDFDPSCLCERLDHLAGISIAA